MSPLVTSLWITLIGMGLVFVAILLLWGLMELLMRFTARYSVAEAAGEAEDQNVEILPPDLPAQTAGQEQRKQAAAAAVAIALAMRQPTVLTALSGPASAWRAITRSRQLNQATHIPQKSRGSVR